VTSLDLGSLPSGQDETDRFTRFTQREMSVLRLASEGYTNTQIGLKLNISKYTVAQHIS
jgi:DNA-binding NarL/FixJ family response regulator